LTVNVVLKISSVRVISNALVTKKRPSKYLVIGQHRLKFYILPEFTPFFQNLVKLNFL